MTVFHTQLKFNQLYSVAVIPSDATGAQTWITALGCTFTRTQLLISYFWILREWQPDVGETLLGRLWLRCFTIAQIFLHWSSKALDNGLVFFPKKKKETLCIARAIQSIPAGRNYLCIMVWFQKVPYLFLHSFFSKLVHQTKSCQRLWAKSPKRGPDKTQSEPTTKNIRWNKKMHRLHLYSHLCI